MFAFYLSVVSFAQGIAPANALTNLDEDYAYQTTIALYGTFDVATTYSGSAWEVLNHRVITDYSGNQTTNYNKILFIGPTQINIVLYSTDNTSTLYPNSYAFSTYNSGPVSVTIKVQKFDGSNWNTYKSVTRNVRLVNPVPKVNPSNNVIYGLIYDPAGNYIKFHDGTSASPIYTGSAIPANRNFFVPYVTGAAYASAGYNSCYPPPYISKYLTPFDSTGWQGTVPSGDIYGNTYFNSGFEGIQQVNFRVPSNANNMKLVFGITGNCSQSMFSYTTTSTKFSIGSWY